MYCFLYRLYRILSWYNHIVLDFEKQEKKPQKLVSIEIEINTKLKFGVQLEVPARGIYLPATPLWRELPDFVQKFKIWITLAFRFSCSTFCKGPPYDYFLFLNSNQNVKYQVCLTWLTLWGPFINLGGVGGLENGNL